ncbi:MULTISPECIES: FRG domain-containing protein [unclassified Nocardioides]|uniref:FRG domain-containing protein n=1 Tax=unclassified Nocardioides TaxID=2615069 RepID=UPI000702DEEF|nr:MULTISPECIES: FRG domain-containing protein [unclassified Nocardioides]KRC46472.1 hypothetical protein ASE19_21875 [Nocardioides sp. Root79]KRC69816.1 hypothetical protein ASE20_14725 [Nocardioides sp. Root240]
MDSDQASSDRTRLSTRALADSIESQGTFDESAIADAAGRALDDAARNAVGSPMVQMAIQRAVTNAVRGDAKGLAALGIQSSAVESAVNRAIASLVDTAVATPEVRLAIRRAVDQAVSRESSGLVALGIGDSTIRTAVGKAITELARTAVATPAVRDAIDKAIRGGRTGFAAFGPSLIESAVSTAVTSVAKESASSPEVRSAIDKAIRRDRSGLAGLGPSTVDAAVSRALTDAAKSAIHDPEIQAAVDRAVRHQASSGSYAADPAVVRELGKHLPEEDAVQEPTAEQRHARTPLVPSDADYSSQFENPGSLFSAHEARIDSFAALTEAVGALTARNPGLKFVWRGQQDASWGLHSSLYRSLMGHHQLGTKERGGADSPERTFPDETAMLDAELAILAEAADWRMSDLSALELFARLQHHGGPTRLLDVTRNPLIAAWFAVEDGAQRGCDGRLFALATAPAVEAGGGQGDDDPLLKEVLAGKRYPFWSGYNSPQIREETEWGTGTRRRLWVPPAYDARIAAQNAAFLLEGVPMLTRANLKFFTDSAGKPWSAADVAASLSIYARPISPLRKARPNKARLAPLFSFRIAVDAKDEIRQMLTSAYGYTTSLVYPDIQGMSQRLRNRSDWLAPHSQDDLSRSMKHGR